MFTQMVVKAEPVGFSNCFVLEVEYSHGDDDAITQTASVVRKEDLFDIANFYAACEQTVPQGAGGPGYSKVPGFDRFGDFSSDATYEGYQASLNSWAVFYYSPAGTKFPVEFQ